MEKPPQWKNPQRGRGGRNLARHVDESEHDGIPRPDSAVSIRLARCTVDTSAAGDTTLPADCCSSNTRLKASNGVNASIFVDVTCCCSSCTSPLPTCGSRMRFNIHTSVGLLSSSAMLTEAGIFFNDSFLLLNQSTLVMTDLSFGNLSVNQRFALGRPHRGRQQRQS